MSKTKSYIKDRYNRKTYGVLSVRIRKETLAAFKEKCGQEGISQASVVKKAVEEFIKSE